MKLIELLVQELPKRGGWPDGAGRISMHADGAIFFDGNCTDDIKLPKCDDGWNSKLHPFEYTNEVTREQYEAALAAAQQPVWSGDGLPPVGCEIEGNSPSRGWTKAIVTAVTDNWLVAKYPDGAEFACAHRMLKDGTFIDDRDNFRPICLEAERKRKLIISGIETAYKNCPYDDAVSEAIYDAIAAGKIPGVKLSD